MTIASIPTTKKEPQAVALSREEVANVEVGRTDISPDLARVLVAVFLATIVLVPFVQLIREVRQHRSGALESFWPSGLDGFRAIPASFKAFREAEGSLIDQIKATNRVLARGIHDYESQLEDQSILSKALRPSIQYSLTRWLGAGNEKAYIGRDGWCFYRPDVEYLTGAPFLDERQLKRRAALGEEWATPPQPDARKAILQFQQQLAERGIQLIIFPVPSKPAVHAVRMCSRYAADAPILHNASYANFVEEMRRTGIHIFDASEFLWQAKTEHHDADLYLATDTHWRPEVMEEASAKLAQLIETSASLSPARPGSYRQSEAQTENLGDTARMFQFPDGQQLFLPETVAVHPVSTAGDEIWRPSATAEALLLGDSFSNIYSLEAMNWGESAGLAEHLSVQLQRPVDVILRNDDGAHATRLALSQELARGKDRLAGKKIVVWQFAERELASGDWRMMDMALGNVQPAKFAVPESGQTIEVTGIVEDVSATPRPGAAVYADHIFSIHLGQMRTLHGGNLAARDAVVYLWSMRGNERTEAASLRPSQEIHLRLRAWRDVEQQYGAIKRSALDDEALAFEEPFWGETLAKP